MTLKQLLAAAFVVLFLYGMFTVGGPFLLALIVVILLEPALQLVMRTLRLSRLWAALGLYTLVTLLLSGLVFLVGLKIVSQAGIFFKQAQTWLMHEVPIWRAELNTWTERFSPEVRAGIDQGLDSAVKSAIAIAGDLSRMIVTLAAKLPGLFIALLVFVIALYLFAFGLPRMKQSFLSLFADSSRDKMDHVLVSLRKTVFGFLRAQLLISGITYLIVVTGLFVLKVEYALVIALVITLVDALPILGTSAVLFPWAIVSFIGGNLHLGAGLLLLFLVLAVIRRIIEPKILGDSVGISAIAALLALYIGFKLVGVIGLFLGPAVVVIFQALRRAGLFQFKIEMD